MTRDDHQAAPRRRPGPRSRRASSGGLAGLLLVAACGGAPPAAPAPDTRRPPETGAPSGRARRVTVRHDPADLALLSPQDDHLVRAVEVAPLGQGLLVDSLANPGAEPLVLGLGLAASAARFVGPTLLLTFDARAGIAALLSLDGGGEARFPCRLPPLTTEDGTALVTLDAEGRLTALDPETLGVRWSLPAPRPSPAASDPELRPGPGSRVVMAYDEGAVVVDVAARTVHFAAHSSDPVVSPSGRYVGEVVPAEDEAAAPAWLVSIADTTRGAVIFSARAPGTAVTVGTPPLAFSRDERTAAYSVEASSVHVIDLATSREQPIRTGLSARTEVAEYLTDALAFGADGGFLCGHVASTLGAETACGGQIFAELTATRARPGRGDCVIAGDVAVRFPPSARLERGGRRLLPNAHSPNLSVCNHALSPDRRWLAVATARTRIEDGVPAWTDTELSLFDLLRGEVERRFALGDAGSHELVAGFSPGGRWVTVEMAGRSLALDARTGRAFTASEDWPSWPGGSEALWLRRAPAGLEVVALEAGSARRFPDAVGTFCLDGGRLRPVARCSNPRAQRR